MNKWIAALQEIPKLPDQNLWVGRQIYRASTLQYLKDRPQLEVSAYPESKEMFKPVTLSEVLDRACVDFTSVLSMAKVE